MSAPATERQFPWGLVKLVFAIAILFLIARTVPWTDSLVVTGPEGDAQYAGTIEGDWSAETIDFVLDPEVVAAGVPEPLDGLADGEGRLSVTRDERLGWLPGMPRVFRGLEVSALGIALLLMIAGILFTSTRWWRLLAAAECPTGWWGALRLTVLGFFFNIVIPGLTGGDVIKAVLVAKQHPERKAAAVISIVMDRLLGLYVLATLVALVVFKLWDQMEEIRLAVMLGVVAGAVGTAVYFSGALRRLVRFDALMEKLPGGGAIKKLDEAVLIYSKHPADVAWALLFSLGNHVAVIGAIYLLALSFGADLSVFEGFAVIAIGNMVSSLPIAPGGWGVGEAAYGYLFNMLGSSSTLGIATSITFRLTLMAIGLAGGLLLFLPGGQEALAATEEAKDLDDGHDSTKA